MRIAVVTTRDRQVSETFISDYMTVLRDLGHEVLFFPLRSTEGPEWAARYTRSHEAGCTQVSEACGELLEASFGEWAYRLTAIYPALCTALRDAKPDVIHAHYLTPSGALCVEGKTKGLLGDIPVVISLHGVDIFRNGRSVPQAAAWCCRNADAIIYNSPAMHAILQSWGVAERATHYVRRGVLLDKFPRPLRSRAEPSQLLTVARLVPKKGLDTLLMAFARVLAAWQRPLTLRIIGEGPERARLQELASAAQISDSVEFLGELPNKTVLREIRRSDVFCLLSRTADDGDMDGAPNVLQEAQYLRVPVVSTWISGIPTVVCPRRTAILVSPGDHTAAADAILGLLNDPVERARMGEEGRRFVRRELSMLENVRDQMMPTLCKARRTTGRRSCTDYEATASRK